MINLRDYEAVVIIKPHLEDEEINKIVNTIEENIIQRNGELITKPLYEKRKLAYQINKYSDGYFAFFYYVGNVEITKRIDEVCRFNENILRLINFRLESRDNVLHGLRESDEIKEGEEINVDSFEDEEEEE
ncbi:30S ribosomal protein S6 [bacterium]|nr:30S ribosomal protein S6 [bacterium]